jgi:hypothetical protein
MKEKEDFIMNASISELQINLLADLINRDSDPIEKLTLEDILSVYLQHIESNRA